MYRTIETDIECGFDLIHIDFSLYNKGYKYKLAESKKAIKFALERNDKIILEIGTDENTGKNFKDIKIIKNEINFFKSFSTVAFYVPQAGSLVKEINQVGSFSFEYIKRVKKELIASGILLKEHNADYLSAKQIKSRKDMIDAFNIAPCLGVLQTIITIQKCITYGIDYNEFLEDSYNSGRWKKWMHYGSKSDKFLSALISGHYVFANRPYKKICKQLSKFENFHENSVNEIMIYIKNFYKNII